MVAFWISTQTGLYVYGFRGEFKLVHDLCILCIAVCILKGDNDAIDDQLSTCTQKHMHTVGLNRMLINMD